MRQCCARVDGCTAATQHRTFTMRIHTSLLAALLASLPIAAQTQVGDIALTGFSTNAFGVFRSSITAYTTPGFGSGTSQTILWDDAVPHTFWIAGFGFLGRAQILGPGSVSYATLTTNVGIACNLSFDAQRRLVFSDAGSGQMRSFDPATNLVTDLTTGPQPWGLDLNCSALDPLTGDVIAGGNGTIYRLPAGATTANATPVTTGLGGYVTGLAFDVVTGEILATVLAANRVVRINAAGTATDVCPPFSVPGPNSLDIDQNGDLITGGGTGQVYRIARTGGSPVFLVNNSSPFGNVNGVAVVGGGGYGRPFGTACNGVFGPALLRASGSFRAGQTITTTSINHASTRAGVLVLGLSNTSYLGNPLPWLLDPVLGTSGCSLFASGDATFAGTTGVSGVASLSFTVALTASFAGQRFYAQHVVLEPVPGGLSWSNGLAFQIR